jgi:hypothetical protein
VLLTLDGEIVQQCAADPVGGYRFDGVPAGVYVLAIEGTGVFSSPLTVDGAQPAVVDLEAPPPLGDKALARYILFGAPGSARTAVHLAQSRNLLAMYLPTFGFNPDEAAAAQSVIIVGGLADVGQEVEDRLAAAGCRVERIQGDAQQVAAGLERVLNPGGPV